MAEQTFKTKLREAVGSSATRKLRGEGQVPAVLYGHGEAVANLALGAADVHEIMASGHHLVSLEVGGGKENAIIKDVQWDVWGREVLHVDFSRVALDELVVVQVEVVAHGTPKEVLSGAVLEQPLRSIEVSCKADHIPDEIVVEVGDMVPTDKIHVRELVVPEGVSVTTDPEAVIFTLQEQRGEVEVAEEAPAESVAGEPEVIGRGKEAAEEPTEK